MFYEENVNLIEQKISECFKPFFEADEVIKDLNLDFPFNHERVLFLVDNIKIKDICTFAIVEVNIDQIELSLYIDNDLPIDERIKQADIYKDSPLNDLWVLYFEPSDPYGYEIRYTYKTQNIDLQFRKIKSALSMLKEHPYELKLLQY